ncbi:exported hypothetical protein [Cupriavidus taiwanensis]|uniref:Uncharacterized protein n=1 Tax=Cupriavidus taiwanensis TaxID=164546 RepID=A0A375JGP9_9BURK|nr:exported hypothetical protein [Cupriavidus taiwanensis]
MQCPTMQSPQGGRRARRPGAAIAAAVAILLVSACGGGDDPAPGGHDGTEASNARPSLIAGLAGVQRFDGYAAGVLAAGWCKDVPVAAAPAFLNT